LIRKVDTKISPGPHPRNLVSLQTNRFSHAFGAKTGKPLNFLAGSRAKPRLHDHRRTYLVQIHACGPCTDIRGNIKYFQIGNGGMCVGDICRGKQKRRTILGNGDLQSIWRSIVRQLLSGIVDFLLFRSPFNFTTWIPATVWGNYSSWGHLWITDTAGPNENF
jgi:hypothetical protein